MRRCNPDSRSGIGSCLLLTCLLMCLFVCSPLTGRSWGAELETRVKAAYIYNFTRFIEWPNEQGMLTAPFTICITGSDSLRTTLGELSNRQAKGRPIKVVRVKEGAEMAECELLVISLSEERQLADILRRVQGKPVVTVSDIDQFAQRGGMIGFTTDKERVKVVINQRVAREAGVRLSAKLLEVARILQ